MYLYVDVLCSGNSLSTWKARKAHSHTRKLFYQRDVSGEERSQNFFSCVVSFLMLSGNQTQSDDPEGDTRG